MVDVAKGAVISRKVGLATSDVTQGQALGIVELSVAVGAPTETRSVPLGYVLARPTNATLLLAFRTSGVMAPST